MIIDQSKACETIVSNERLEYQITSKIAIFLLILIHKLLKLEEK